LEVRECIEIMNGSTQAHDLLEVTLALSAEMLLMAGAAKNVAAAKEILQKKLANGEALHKFAEMIAAQGGDAKVCDDVQRLPSTKQTKPIPAPKAGIRPVNRVRPNRVRGHRPRRWSSRGGGQVDFAVGFEEPKKIGDVVKAGEPLMIITL